MTFTKDPTERLDQLFPEALHLWRLDHLYQDLDQACYQLTGRNLKPSEKACLRGLLCRYRPGQIAFQLNWTSGTLRVELNKGLYRFIELLADQPANTLRWEKVGEWLENYRQDRDHNLVVPPNSLGGLIDWGEAPEVAVFLGRQEELTNLQRQVILERCRLIAIWGMGGIGKTALAVKLVESLKLEFERIIWRSLRHLQPLEQFLADLHKHLAQKSEGDISQLLDLMKRHRYLVVLDDFEAILQEGELAGAYRSGYENYRELLERLGQERHQSCLILLSREQPKEIAVMHGDSLNVRSLRLGGIQRQGARELLKARGFSGSESGVEELVQQYRGNPAALKIVATTIHEVFNGNISEFLNQTMLGMGDILLNLLYSQFERLSHVEKDVIYWLALKRRPVSLASLRRDLSSSGTEVINALESLRWRSLIEKATEAEQVCFLLEPVVMKYVNKKFVHECAKEVERLVEAQSLRQVRLLRSHILVEDYAPDSVRAVQIRLTLKPLKDHLLLELANQDLTLESLNRALSRSAELVGYTAANLALLGLWQ
ncbi:MAG: NB-ARC domain-containing protein [Pseudanabaenaceae cyanobacterium bins.68]|nr:NB-ARC domain-containing protein [Pseudanabaenaceae cyanobacterium bins.68]